MDKKTAKILGISVAGILAGWLIYKIITKEGAEDLKELRREYPTVEQIKILAKEESEKCENMTKKASKTSPIFTKEFSEKVFYILSKYATMLKRT